MGNNSSSHKKNKDTERKLGVRENILSDIELKLVELKLEELVNLATGCSYHSDLSLLKKEMKIITTEPDQVIMEKGDEAVGVFLLLKGQIDIIDIENDLTIARLEEGEYFGEMSTLFGMRISATVKAATECCMVFLNVDVMRALIPSVAMDIVTWHVHHKYVPIGEVVLREAVPGGIAFAALKNLRLCADLPTSSLRAFIKGLQPILTIYPPNSTVLMSDDPPTQIHVVIKGSITIKDRTDQRLLETMDTKPQILLGESCYFTGKNYENTVQAATICLVITLGEDDVSSLKTLVPTTWDLLKQEWEDYALKCQRNTLFTDFSSLLDFDGLFCIMRSSNMMSVCSDEDLQRLCRCGDAVAYNENDCIFSKENIFGKNSLIIILLGSCGIKEENDIITHVYIEKDIFCPYEKTCCNASVIALSSVLAFLIDHDTITSIIGDTELITSYCS